jgi:ketosteroid isomerase-like protein
MSVALPRLIQNYIDASNAHAVQSILACFADDATVHDENATHRGKIDIEQWLRTTIEKYKFQFKPLSAEAHDHETVVAVQISGTFPGSPITLDYHFTIAGTKIASLIIDS